MAEQKQPESTLDIGCGTGELVCGLSSKGISAVGIDFAEEMIKLSRQLAATRKLKAKFIHSSVFDYEPDRKFDLISANGLIEYIPESSLHSLIAKCHDWLNPGGSIILGSRNRLFNCISLNAYTLRELENGTIPSLLREATTIVGSPDLKECLQVLSGYRQELPTFDEHPVTGIAVSTRHQYTPAQLVSKLGGAGFDAIEISPIHYHGISPTIGKTNPELHVAIAEAAQQEADFRMLPFSSSFMIHAVR